MAAAVLRPKDVRLYLGGFFALFLIANVVLLALAAIGELANKHSMQLLPADFPPAGRLLIFAIGLGISWAVGHYLYAFLMEGEVSVRESVTAATIFLLYFAFLFAGIAFLGALGWLWLGIGLLVLLVVSVIALWRLVGPAYVIGALVLAAVAAWLTFFLVR
jgi:hypothetical protein